MSTIIELLSRRFSSRKWADWSTTDNPEIVPMISKLAGRSLAESLGIPTPQLLYSGPSESLNLESLPRQYVLKSARGSAASRVFLMDDGFDWLRKVKIQNDQLHTVASSWDSSVLVEEFIQDSLDKKPPIDYKLFVFGAHVDSLMLFDRTGNRQRIISYSTEWERIPSHMNNKLDGPEIPRPNLLADLLQAASKIGQFFKTFLRVDMYCSPHGILFGELCCNPCSGRYFSDWADKHFGQVWKQYLGPDAI